MSEQVENQPKSITPRVIVLKLIVVVGIPFLPLLTSRQWDWWEAWVYAFISIFGFAISRVLAARRHPDLLAERARFLRHEDAKAWDKYLAPMVGLGSGFILIVVGLDALNDWSPAFSLLVKTLALFAILAGYALGTLALMENRFFSGMVRIQSERGHHVVSSGPYGCIRDPGYAGALMNLGQRLLITIFVILTLGAITACRESHSSPALPRQDAAVTPDQVAHIGADDQATPTDIPLPDVIRPPADLWRDPVPTAALEAARSLASARYYRQDPIDVVYRFQNPDRLIPEVTRQEPWGFQIGDSHVFWVEDKVSLEQYQVKADLVYETSHAYYFVEEGVEVNGSDLGVLAERFETRIYPTTRSFLGEEWSPGVDSDPHLVFLFVGRLGGGVGGYHDDRDGYSQLVYPSSNEMEMIYLSANGLTLDSPSTECLLAHEFQHLIRWAVDQDEAIWLNEAFGELACSINDLAPHYRGRITDAFARDADIQLNGWTRDRNLVEAQYGASYLFITYFHDRFGDEAVRALSDHPANGLQGIEQTLDSLPGDPDFETVFADWVVANLIDDSELNDGRYGYRSYHPQSMSLDAEYGAADIPIDIQGRVNQFGADAISLVGPGVFMVDFAGENLVRLVPPDGSEGEVYWWSGPGTKSDSTLTREFDLTGLSEATLTFSTRYDMERYFNYAYVAISTGDDHWSPLPGLWTSAEDPSGMNLGHGYTGNSGGWKEERIDLTPYTGQVVRLRFEYLALGGPLGSGFFINQVAIPELGYEHDLAVDDGGWEARGFLRLANLLPQKWLVQLVSRRSGGIEMEHLVIEPDNRGSWRFELDEDEMVTLLISGITRGTTEASGYWIAVR